jgi:methylated-DNA-protein-cysteine methyltransferase-like protein
VTEFESAVEAVIAALEPGELITYGEVALEAGWPGRARAVGAFLAASGDGGLPWWRVVPASGRLADHLVDEQSRRLASEGVVVRDGRISRDR